MAPRNPRDKDFATLEALQKLELLVGENSTTIKQILTLLGGDPFKNGKGIVDRLRDLEQVVATLKQDIRKEIKSTIQEELKQFSQNGKKESFKDYSTLKKITAIVVVTSALGIGATGILNILDKIIEFLQKLIGG